MILTLYSQCTVSKYSNKQKNEETSMKVVDDETYLAQTTEEQPLARGVKSRGLITANMLLQGVSLGTESLKKFIDKEKKKYVAEYTDGLSNLYFYSHLSAKNAWDPEGIQFKEFTFVRLFETKSGKMDTALRLTFMLDTSSAFEIYNNATFRLRLKDIYVKYAKAKLPTKRWYFPWSYMQKKRNDKIDLDIEIDFTGNYNTEQGLMVKDADLGKFYLLLRDAPLNPSDPDYKKYYEELIHSQLDGYSFIVPRSFGHYFDGTEYKPCYSQGKYSIAIKITESGNEKYIDKLIMEHSSTAIDAMYDQLKKIK